MKKITVTLMTILSVALAALAFAALPQTINYQGYLKDGNGLPVNATTISFRLYSSASPVNPLWSGQPQSVTPANGIYNTQIGPTDLPFDRHYWLGVTVGSDPELKPLQKLDSVPYALRAATADSSVSAVLADGLSGPALSQLDSRYIDPTLPARPTTEQIAMNRWNQASQVSIDMGINNNPTALTFDGFSIWVALAGNGTTPGTVQRINPANTTLSGSAIPVGINPRALLFDGTNIWVANKGSNTVTKIIASSGAVVNSYPTGGGSPQALAYDGSYIWVANGTDNTVTRIIPATGALFGTPIVVGSNPSAILYDDFSYIWVANQNGNSVSIIDAFTGFVEYLAIGAGVTPVALAQTNGDVHVLSSGSNKIYSCMVGVCIAIASNIPAESNSMISDGSNVWVSGNNGISKYNSSLVSIGVMLAPYNGASAMATDGRNLWLVSGSNKVIRYENEMVKVSFASVGYEELQDASVSAEKIYGKLFDSSLSSNVTLLNSAQIFSAAKTFSVAPNFTVAAGAPFTVVSSTAVTNLNADLLDGNQGSYYLNAGNLSGSLADARLSINIPRLNSANTFSNTTTFNNSTTFASAPDFTTASGSPFTVTSTGQVTNLNAEMVGGKKLVELDTRYAAAASAAPPMQVPRTSTITTIDSTGTVGQYSSITIGMDGLPITAYYDSTGSALKVAKCSNSACSDTATITSVDSAGTTGLYPSIAIGTDGLPVISYLDSTNADLKVAKCTNAACSGSATISTVDSTGFVGYYTSITIGTDGLPVISYYDNTLGALKVAKCSNAACSGAATISIVDESSSIVGSYTSIAIGTDGFPVISYYDSATYDLKAAKCSNTACSGTATISTIDSIGSVGQYTSITIGTDGLPLISYFDATNNDLKAAKCVNVFCSGVSTISTIDSSGIVGDYSSITIGTDGLPIISYRDTSNSATKVAKCANTACSGTSTVTILDNNGGVGQCTSITVGADSLPVISYFDSSLGDLKIAKCSNQFCLNNWMRR